MLMRIFRQNQAVDFERTGVSIVLPAVEVFIASLAVETPDEIQRQD